MTPTTSLTFQLGDPVEHRGVVIAPLFPARDPSCAYLTLDEALPRGLAITEISDGGSVPELAVNNPLDEKVLLYDGEELVGAKQNRILNVTVLVGAGAKLPIPVSCVEQGRWSRSSVDFDSATHISHAHLRRRKAEMLAAQPLARGVAQGEVWDEIGDKQQRMSVVSPTGAARDTFDAYGDRLRSSRTHSRSSRASAAPCSRSATRSASTSCRGRTRSRCSGRSSAAATCSTRSSARPETHRQRAHRRLRRRGRRCACHARPSVGLGDDVRLRGPGVIGSGLELDGELIQLSAFTSTDGGQRAFGRIARPSRRR